MCVSEVQEVKKKECHMAIIISPFTQNIETPSYNKLLASTQDIKIAANRKVQVFASATVQLFHYFATLMLNLHYWKELF